jgi:membrane AbrB-like protein
LVNFTNSSTSATVGAQLLNTATQLGQAIAPKLPAFKQTIALLSLSFLVSLLLNKLGVPVSWIIGSMLVGIVYVLFQGRSQSLVPGAAMLGQVIIAIATAAHFSWETLALATHYALPLLACIVITGGLSIGNGYLLSRWAGIDGKSSLLGCIPGAGPSIVALSEEIGADTLIVAVLQYLRILLVSAIIPLFASFVFTSEPVAHAVTSVIHSNAATMPIVPNLVVLSVSGALGIWGGRRLKLPSSMFLGPFLVALLAFWSLPQQLSVPQPVFILGLLLIGLSIGLKFDWQTMRQLIKAVAIEFVLVLGLIVICFGIAYGFHLITQVDALTAILGSTPGGISTMIASAMQLGGDAGLVMAMQITRMLIILLMVPWLATLWMKRSPIQAPLLK